MYKLTQLPATPIDTLLKAKAIAEKAGCKYVYVGNVPQDGTEDTYCPKCKKKVVERRGFSILSMNVINGKCTYCGYSIHGVWD
jgi:pyruvate formate lyase activating enzyme